MKALITGGAGFIGYHLKTLLLGAGYEVTIIDDLSTGLEANTDGAKLHVQDVRKPLHIDSDTDVIFHLAANASIPESFERPAFDAKVNIIGTINALEAARKCGAKLIYASSSSVYGSPQGELGLAHPTETMVPYATSKLAGEKYIEMYSRLYGMKGISLRLFNVYGPQQRADLPGSGVIAKFCSLAAANKPITIFGDGGQTRDFIYVGDVVKAMLLAVYYQGAQSTFNICTGKNHSLIDVLQIIFRMKYGNPKIPCSPEEILYLPSRRGDIKKMPLAITSAPRELRFTPEVTLEEGLKLVWDSWVHRK